MFDTLNKLFGSRRDDAPVCDIEFDLQPVSLLQSPNSSVAHWALTRGFFYADKSGGQLFTLSGTAGDVDWKLECLPSQREYITGTELKGRAAANVEDRASVVVMNRVLKDVLEKRAFSLYTDSLQTQVQAALTDEMRWLAVYPEAGWDSLTDEFWSRYSVISDRRQYAERWLTPEIAQILMALPEKSLDGPVPTVLMLMRGKVHLRMQYDPDDTSTLERAVQLLEKGSESAKRIVE